MRNTEQDNLKYQKLYHRARAFNHHRVIEKYG